MSPPPSATDAPLGTHIIIPAHNRRETTLGCLLNLREVGAFSWAKVVVVDDGSTDQTADTIEQRFPEVTVLRGDGTLWWTGAMALGMRHSYAQGARVFVWMNDDCRVGPDAIQTLASFVETNPRSIAGAQAVMGNGVAFGGKRRTWKGFRWVHVSSGAIESCDLVSGNLVCIPRTAVDEVGFPDVEATPHYGGDALYLVRCVNAGFRLVVHGGVDARDVGGKSELMPEDWLRAPGGPLALVKLALNPRSGLSWRVWWRINLEAYGPWGLVLFGRKYAAIGAVTAARVLRARRTEAR